MKDTELRGLVLQVFYDARHKIPWLEFNALMSHMMGPADTTQVSNVCDQLAQHRLIDWRALGADGVRAAALGKITAMGVDVIEGTARSPISITLHDHRITVTGSTGVIVGDGNRQDIRMDVGKIVSAIDRSSVSEGEKEEAKSLLERVASNSTLWTALASYLGLAGSAQ